MNRPIRWELRSGSDARSVVEEVVSMFEERDGSPDRCEDVRTAVTEACLNALEHSKESSCEVRVMGDVNGIWVEVEDDGGPFSIPRERPNIKARIEGKERPRGWGLYLMQQLAESCIVERRSDRNIVRLRFDIRTPKGDRSRD